MVILLAVLICLAVGFAGLSAWLLLGHKDTMSHMVKERLQGVQQIADYNLGDSLAVAEKQKKEKKEKRRDIVRQTAFSNIPALQEKLGQEAWAEKLHSRLRQAQLPLTVSRFLLVCAVFGLIGAGLTILWYRAPNPVVTPLAFVALAVVPYLYLNIIVAMRLKKFGLQFPDALDLLSSCVKSGQSLNAAIQNVADEMPDPVADEFRIMADELTFGGDLLKVLAHFRHRVDTEDVQVFCTALQIQKECGGNLSEVLDGLQKTMRERFRILRQVKTLTAQGRLSGWIVGLLPVVLGGVIYLCNPEYMGKLFTEKGKWMLITAAVFQIMGMAIIRKIVNIKV